jgi:hypothetical protein
LVGSSPVVEIISTYSLIVILFIAIPAAAFGTPAAPQGGNFTVSVAGTTVGAVPHQIDLKVTQLPGGQSLVRDSSIGNRDLLCFQSRQNSGAT